MKSANMNYKDAMRAMKDEAIAEQEGKFYEMAPKSSDVWGPVSNAPSQTATGAIQAPEQQGIFAGSGGYEYGQLADGSFMILKSGKGFSPGSIVKPGMKGYNAIKSEFEMVKAGRRPTEKPRAAAPKAAPKAEPPKPRISPYGPTDYDRAKARFASMPYESEEDPRMGESNEDPRMEETVSRSPAELKSSQTYSNAALLTRAQNALVREGTDPAAAAKIVQGLKKSGNMKAIEGLVRLRK